MFLFYLLIVINICPTYVQQSITHVYKSMDVFACGLETSEPTVFNVLATGLV
jgi:hypothetical protein